MGKGRDIFDMSVTEVVLFAIGRNCFRCAVKDATPYGLWFRRVRGPAATQAIYTLSPIFFCVFKNFLNR